LFLNMSLGIVNPKKRREIEGVSGSSMVREVLFFRPVRACDLCAY
jgi:hypothetical protein